jgi:hypothetical protein
MPDRFVGRVEHDVAVILHIKVFGILAVGARRPHGLALRGERQVAVVLQGQRVGPVPRGQRLATLELLAFGEPVCHVIGPSFSR